MMNIFFVKICDFFVYFGEKKDAHYTALLLFSILMFINLYSVISAIELYIYPQLEYRYYLLLVLQITILVINFFVFIYRKKHIEIIKNYREKRSQFKYFDAILTITYIVASATVWIYLGSQLRALNIG